MLCYSFFIDTQGRPLYAPTTQESILSQYQFHNTEPSHHIAPHWKEHSMKKIIALLSVAIFAAAFFAFAAEDTKPELRPAQKVMQARVAWLAAINKNLEAKKFKAIVKDAKELAAQTQKVGENIPNPSARKLPWPFQHLPRTSPLPLPRRMVMS